jgi:hypothetical protein
MKYNSVLKKKQKNKADFEIPVCHIGWHPTRSVLLTGLTIGTWYFILKFHKTIEARIAIGGRCRKTYVQSAMPGFRQADGLRAIAKSEVMRFSSWLSRRIRLCQYST